MMNSIGRILPSALRFLPRNPSKLYRYKSGASEAVNPIAAASSEISQRDEAGPVKRMPTPLAKISEPPMPISSPIGMDKVYASKIVQLVDEISSLTLLEVSDLNELLKKRLNIPDTPMMGPMNFATAGGPSPEEEEAAPPVKVQTSFTLKLMKFDDAKKVALIKECKSLLEGMNLVQAKKFVESAPCVIKADLAKDEAEKLSKALEAVGATCEIS